MAMQIFVRLSNGRTITLDVTATTDTISDVKTKIEDKVDIPIDLQLLVFSGRPLQDDTSTLSACNIQRRSTIYLHMHNTVMGKDVNIYVKALTGNTITLKVNTTDTIKSIMAKIQEKDDSTLQHHLVFAGKELGGRTLSDCWIWKDCTLYLVLHSINVFIRTFSGGCKTFTLRVDANHTIGTVKSMIQDKKGIPTDQQQLSFAGKLLRDDKTLSYYGVQKDYTFDFMLHGENSPMVSTVEPVTVTGGGVMEEYEGRIERRVREAVREVEREKEIAETRQQDAERRASEAERRVREVERRAREVVREAEREKEIAKTRQQEAERRVREVERRARKAKNEKERVEIRWQETERAAIAREQELEEEARVCRERAARAERRLALTEQRSREREEQLQRLETQWVVERREIQLTGPELGRGGWATVSVATFRGARVAAKLIHDDIVSPYNIRLFRREMDMASRIRHPNLLQFIGATNVGQMVILTELMPTSLRRELRRECQFSPRLTISIGLDVARALNYLHLIQPHPLIHRDISSANVLLEPLPVLNCWKAKVSDYGTVNLLLRLDTICPGNPSYAAPEANDPNQQSTKMDIFSFGVLLLEMLTGEFPDCDNRASQLCKVLHQTLLSLIQRCLEQRKEDRPTASDIITELTPQ